MPNTNKPSRKRPLEDEEAEQSSSDDDSGGITSYSYRPPHGGGKQLRPAPSGGGKMLRMPAAEDYDEDEDDESEDDGHSSDSSNSEDKLYAVTTQTHHQRSSGGGKQLRMPSGGKQLRMPSGGKQLRIAPQEEEEESDDDDDQSEGQESSEDEVEEQNIASSFVVSRPGGGKSLANMRPPPVQDNSEDESSAASEKARLPSRPQGGGKSLANMQRQLIVKEPSEDEDEEETASPQSAFRMNGGKSLNNMQRSRGKQLTIPHNRNQQQLSSDSDEDEDNESESSEASRDHLTPQTGGRMFRPPGGGKILQLPNSFNSGLGATPEDVIEKEPMFSDVDEDGIEKKLKKQQTSKSADIESADIAASNADKREIDSMEMSESDSSDDEGIGAAPWASAPKTTVNKAIVMSESESSLEQSSSSDEEEDELDVDKMDPSVLIKDDDDHQYLQSLPEFEREAILGERFEKLKNERDMRKALRDAKRQGRDRKKMLQAQSTMKAEKKKSASKPRKRKDAGTPLPTKPKLPVKIASGDEHTVGKAKIHEGEETRKVEELEPVQAMAESPVDRRESTRHRDSTSLQGKKAAARAAIREERLKKQEQDDNNSRDSIESDDDLDYGSSDDDSEEDYTERPWGIGAVKNDSNKVTASREAKWRDSIAESDTSEKEEEEGGLTSRPIVEATFDDYKAICLPRRRLARWCNEPFFEKAVINSYIRLGIGADEETKKMVYRFCKILGVEIKREYSFPKAPNQKKAITTAKWLKVEFGKHTNCFRMITISDSPPEEAEVMKYIHQLKNSRKQALSKSQARLIKHAMFDTVNNYQYTKDDIDRVVQEKKKNIVARNIGLEKTRIEIEVLAASEALAEARSELNDLQNNSLGLESNEGKIVIAQNNLVEAQKKLDLILSEKQRIVDADEMRKRKIMMSSKVQNWVKVNQRAKEKNRAADYLSYKGHSKQRLTSKEFDPFARRKVKPDILWAVGKGENKDVRQVELEKTVAESSRMLAVTDENMNTSQLRENENKKKIEYLNSQKELIGKRHQFAIDEEVLARTSIMLNGVDIDGDHHVRQERIRRGLSLADYQERKASGRL